MDADRSERLRREIRGHAARIKDHWLWWVLLAIGAVALLPFGIHAATRGDYGSVLWMCVLIAVFAVPLGLEAFGHLLAIKKKAALLAGEEREP